MILSYAFFINLQKKYFLIIKCKFKISVVSLIIKTIRGLMIHLLIYIIFMLILSYIFRVVTNLKNKIKSDYNIKIILFTFNIFNYPRGPPIAI